MPHLDCIASGLSDTSNVEEKSDEFLKQTIRLGPPGPSETHSKELREPYE